MKLLSKLFGGSRKSERSKISRASSSADAAADLKLDAAINPDAGLQSVQAALNTKSGSAAAGVNIWDIDSDDGSADAAPAASAPEKAIATTRARRNRTRLIGFDKSDGDVVDLFEDAPKTSTPVDKVQFPVGWLLVIEGPGRGHAFALVAGMSQIGRGDDQTVRLDFGDAAISRNNHAAVVFDSDSKKFILGHGGKANIVRLNDQPVISNEDLSDGDKIKMGETTLQLKVLCDESFDWSDTESDGEQEDVAIA